jgi:hypothetical protein
MNAECGMRSAECGVRNAECGMGTAFWVVFSIVRWHSWRNSEWGVRNGGAEWAQYFVLCLALVVGTFGRFIALGMT